VADHNTALRRLFTDSIKGRETEGRKTLWRREKREAGNRRIK